MKSHLLSLSLTLHGKGNALALKVDTEDTNHDMLVKGNYLIGVLDIVVAELRDVNKPFDVYADVDKSAEIGNIGDDAWQHLTNVKIRDFVNGRIEGELLEGTSRIAARFV